MEYLKSVSLLTDICVRVETHLTLVVDFFTVGIPAGLLKDMEKWGDHLNRFLNEREPIFLMIQLRKKLRNICTEKFSERTAALIFFYIFFLGNRKKNFFMRTAVNVFCK